jgi:tRNA/rRNA methyltransferase/tRNA (cytidine32/uridine32-2'-O)-methyltransferase
MKNMGLTHLRLVLPAADAAHTANDPTEARNRAVHAEDVLDKAGRFESLKEAVADCTFAVGTTRRTGEKRAPVSMTPGETAAFIAGHPGPAALVFGNERSGLDEREMALCSMASHIPSNPDCPSLNLSHAVQVYTWELYKALGQADAKLGKWVGLPQSRIDQAVQTISDTIAILGAYEKPGRERQEAFFHSLISRAALTEHEVTYLEAVFNRAAHLALKPTDNSSLRQLPPGSVQCPVESGGQSSPRS